MPSPGPSPTPGQNLQQLINRAIQEFDDYQRLVSQGKFAEAGQKLEQHKRTLDEIRRFPMLEPGEEYMLAKRWREHEDRWVRERLDPALGRDRVDDPDAVLVE